LPPAEGARHRDDARWPPQARRRPALRAPGRRRVPAQPHHRLARLPGTGGRGSCRETPRTGHVRDRRSCQEAARQRTRTLPAGRMAAGARTHPAPRPEDRGTAGRGRPGGCAMNALHVENIATPASTAPVVVARHLRKAYKNKVALDGTTFEIPAGRIVGLIGPNGAGKTTALKALLGLIPFEGELQVM